jgi:hypothetical protein
MDTVTFVTVEGDVSFFVEANVTLVDVDGREVERFTSSARQSGRFMRGEFPGDPTVLPLRPDEERFFDAVQIGQLVGRLHEGLIAELAGAIAAGTYDTVLSGIY